MDVTHESGSGVTAWNSNEERDYALNKDTTPAIWVMALKSTASHTLHSVGQKEFDALFAASKTKIVKFICHSCTASTHKEIYYKRIKPMNNDFSLYALMYLKWQSTNNALNNHFELYSTYEDAVNGNAKWTSCNYADTNSDTMGFPRDCGPNSQVTGQWIDNDLSGRQELWEIWIDTPDSGIHPWIQTMDTEIQTSLGELEFNNLFDAAPEPKIIRRTCATCSYDHKDMYYRRLTPVPSSLSMYDLMYYDRWTSENNVLGIDYDLYSTFGDAKVGRTQKLVDDGAPFPWWEYCNYDNDGSKGWSFPGECRPKTTPTNGITPTNQWGLSFKTRVLVNQGNDGCTASSPCATCAGDCDSDDQCTGTLTCKQRDACTGNPIPGCIQGGSGDDCDSDYCSDGTARTDGQSFYYQLYIQTTKAVTKTECCTNYRIRALDVQGTSTNVLDMAMVQLYEEADNSDTSTQAFNLGPDLEHGADYNQVAVVWDGFDSSNQAKNFVSFRINTHLFVDTVDATIELSQVTTNNDQARAWFDTDGGATFCRATSLNGGSKFTIFTCISQWTSAPNYVWRNH